LAYYKSGKMLFKMIPKLKRCEKNPIITREDIQDIFPDTFDVTSVFNPGAIKYKNRYLLMLRVQKRSRETVFIMAESENGVDFTVDDKIVRMDGIEEVKEKIYHCYDPRITEIDGIYYIMFAMDMEQDCRLGLAKTDNFLIFEFIGIVADEDIRNGVLFPELFDGKYLRLDRPNTVKLEDGPTSGDTICLSESKNLIDWKRVGTVAKGRFHYWDEGIGSGPPPVKTRKGWLHLYHGIARHFGSPVYQAGIMLLDLENPCNVIARSKNNILEPRYIYEYVGQVPNVVFPSGMIVKEYDQEGFAKLDSEVFIYYGAADTSVGLATTTINKLISACYD